MGWIKRNLFFLIVTLIALGLIGAGGFYLYTQITEASSLADDINKASAALTELNRKQPQPGPKGATNDNVEVAKQQTAVVNGVIGNARKYFARINMRVNTRDFPKQLDDVVAEMRGAAAQGNVTLSPNDYYFTFEPERTLLTYPPGAVPRLAMHLSEIKVICDILFSARINKLLNIQREVACTNDVGTTHFLPPDVKTTTTPLVDMTPYSVCFDCFSGELATVMGGLAASKYGLVVKEIEVQPEVVGGAGPLSAPGMVAPPGRRGGPGSRSGVTIVNENLLRVQLMIDVVKPRK